MYEMKSMKYKITSNSSSLVLFLQSSSCSQIIYLISNAQKNIKFK